MLLVLVTGVGNVGKSSFRRHLVKILKTYRYTVLYADADGYSEARNAQDTELIDVSHDGQFASDVIYVIEDIHAFSSDALLPLERYDLVFYVTADLLTHTRFWLGRSWQWFKRGAYEWQSGVGFRGTGHCLDPRNLSGLMHSMLKHLLRDRLLVHNDLETLRLAQVRTVCVDTHQTKRGPEFSEPLLGHFPKTLRRT